MRKNTWTNIGKTVEECKDVRQVIRAAGLDYTVEPRPVFAKVGNTSMFAPIKDRFITTRTSDGHTYDIVSNKYSVVQNTDAFDFVNYMGNDIRFEKAGETASGMVFIIARLPSVDILGDKFTPHVIFKNGFGGKTKITAAICPLRIICENQFNFAFKNTQNSITIRHVGNVEHKLEEARNVLKMSADYMGELNEQAEMYAKMGVSERQVEKVINLLFPEKENSFAKYQIQTAKDAFIKAYNAEDNLHFHGSAWSLVNAYTDYITHKEPMGKTTTKEENNFMTVVFHPALMNRILDLVCVA